MSDDVLKTLTNAKDLISNPSRWTKGYFARNAKGDICEAWDKKAVCWCAYGALRKAAGLNGQATWGNPYYDAEDVLYNAVEDDGGPVHLNDTGTHEDVMAMFDRAIEAEKAKSHDQDH